MEASECGYLKKKSKQKNRRRNTLQDTNSITYHEDVMVMLVLIVSRLL